MATYLEQQELAGSGRELVGSGKGNGFVHYSELRAINPSSLRLGKTNLFYSPFGQVASTLFTVLPVAAQDFKFGSGSKKTKKGVVILDTCAITYHYNDLQEESSLPARQVVNLAESTGESGEYFLRAFFSYADALRFITEEGRVYMPLRVKDEISVLRDGIYHGVKRGEIEKRWEEIVEYLNDLIKIGGNRRADLRSYLQEKNLGLNPDADVIGWASDIAIKLKTDTFVFTRDKKMKKTIERAFPHLNVIFVDYNCLPVVRPSDLYIPKEGELQNELVSILSRRWRVNSLDELLRV